MLAIKKLDGDLRLHVNLCVTLEKNGKYFPLNLDVVNRCANLSSEVIQKELVNLHLIEDLTK